MPKVRAWTLDDDDLVAMSADSRERLEVMGAKFHTVCFDADPAPADPPPTRRGAADGPAARPFRDFDLDDPAQLAEARRLLAGWGSHDEHDVQDPGPVPVRAARLLPGQRPAAFARQDRNPLAFSPQALTALQGALDARESSRFLAADPQAEFATLTTATRGAPRVWGANVLRGPRVLHVIAGVPRQDANAIFGQFPSLTLPTAQASVGEGVSLVEYATSAAGSVTMGRFGRWTDLSAESMIGTDAGAIGGMHQLGIALDLDNVLIGAVNTAAGAAVAFTADVPAAIRKAMALVMANTATADPTDLVICVHPDNAALLEAVSPIGGLTIGEAFQRFSGALVYPSNAVPTGFALVANLVVGARYFEARALQTATHTDVKTGVQTMATFIICGYGITVTAGFVSKVDIVTP